MKGIVKVMGITALLAVSTGYASLVNIGDQQTIVLDSNVNFDPNYGGVPVSIEFTAGAYELTFLDTNPERTAWNYFPGGQYLVGGVRITEEGYVYDHNLVDPIGHLGDGNTQTEAFANAAANSSLTVQFSISQDVTGHAFVADLDTNNSGGVTFEITKVIPEPSSISMIAIVGITGYVIRRRFLI